MSRIEYGDPGDPVARLWQATSKRALGGKPGQKALREIEAALVALPTKRLIEGEWAARGEVCSLAAVDIQRTMDRTGMCWDAARLVIQHNVEEESYRWTESYEIEDSAKRRLGYTRTLIWEVMEKNDEQFGHVSPEERYRRMLTWVWELIKS